MTNRSPLSRSYLAGFLLPFLLAAAPMAGQELPILSRCSGSGVERAVDSLLSLMTVDEKIGQMVQYSAERDTLRVGRLTVAQQELIREGAVGSILNLVGASVVHEAQRIAVEESRLGIPIIFGLDVIHGFRTIFPIPLASASTFDPDLVEKAERAAAREATAAGIHWTFAPMVDIARDPRWGRIAEGAGEDTYLGSAMAAARVRGFQDRDLSRPDALLACPKHFAAYGGAEGGRDYNTVDISERTLREVYLPPFHAAIDAGAGSIMCSFNEIAGVPSSSNKRLLTTILRGEWGFPGFVVSDWNSIGELLNHGIAATRSEAGAVALAAGVDMDMEANVYHQELREAVKRGEVTTDQLDRAVRRILRMKFALGLFADPYRGCDPANESAAVLAPEHRALARDVARRSIVLLKNEKGVLPLRRDAGTVAVVGPLADDAVDLLGPWSAEGRAEDVVTALRGLRSAATGEVNVEYARGCGIRDSSTSGFGEALALARRSDVVVAVVGESRSMSGEAASRSSLDLPGRQEELVEALVGTGKPVVVVLMNGRPLTIPWIADRAGAVVEAWFLGSEAGSALADVLFGEYNPSGRLPVTFPRSVGQIPIYYNHKNTGRPPSESDRWTSKYIDLPSTPLYPFGFGLSYTTFAHSGLALDRPVMHRNDTLTVLATVKNTGRRRGMETVQLYLHNSGANVTRPVEQLRGFRKVELNPGETGIVEFRLTEEELKFYDLDMHWTVKAGAFQVMVGPNCAETQSATFEYRP